MLTPLLGMLKPQLTKFGAYLLDLRNEYPNQVAPPDMDGDVRIEIFARKNPETGQAEAMMQYTTSWKPGAEEQSDEMPEDLRQSCVLVDPVTLEKRVQPLEELIRELAKV